MLKPVKASQSEASNSSKRIYLFNILDKKSMPLFLHDTPVYTHIDDVGQSVADRVSWWFLHFSSVKHTGLSCIFFSIISSLR